MNRRDFVKNAGMAAGAIAIGRLPVTNRNFRTKHVIWIVNGNGSRKRDWYERPDLSPNYARLVRNGFVYTESHNDTIANHNQAWAELITGNSARSSSPLFPTLMDYIRRAHGDEATKYWFVNGGNSYRQWRLTEAEKQRLEEFRDATGKSRLEDLNLKYPPIPREPFIGDALGLARIPQIMKEFKPRLLIYHQAGHDVGHGDDGDGCLEYEKVCRTTDEQLGRIIDFVQNDPYFSTNTAIVIRPEFGRDDEATRYGELHHSDGYPQSMRSAEIWYGPDFKAGVSNRVTNRRDVVPSIAKLFNVETPYATGVVHSEMFRQGP